MKRLLPALPLLLLLAACLPFAPTRSPSEIYRPELSVQMEESLPRVTWQLVVSRPIAGQLMDSTRILVRPRPGQLQVYSGAIWSDSAPSLVQASIVTAFEDSGHILAVGRPGGGLRADYTLGLELRAFESVYRTPGQPPEIVVELHAKLLQSNSNQVLGARTFRATRASPSTNVADVAASFGPPLSEVTSELVAWTLRVGEANAQSVGRR